MSGDAHRLQQILANLLSNARRHTPPGTQVTAGLAATDGTVELTVSDNGPGIPAELRPHLFERFVHGEGPREESAGAAGTGLGLSIVAAVAAAHDGSVAVASEPGGTRFTVCLPRDAPAPA